MIYVNNISVNRTNWHTYIESVSDFNDFRKQMADLILENKNFNYQPGSPSRSGEAGFIPHTCNIPGTDEVFTEQKAKLFIWDKLINFDAVEKDAVEKNKISNDFWLYSPPLKDKDVGMFSFIARDTTPKNTQQTLEKNSKKNIYIKSAFRFFRDNPTHFQVLPIAFHYSGRKGTTSYAKKNEMV